MELSEWYPKLQVTGNCSQSWEPATRNILLAYTLLCGKARCSSRAGDLAISDRSVWQGKKGDILFGCP